MMLRLLIRKEILSHVLSFRFAVTFVIFLVLIFTSIYVTVNGYEQEIAEHGARVRAYQEHLKGIITQDDHDRIGWRLFWDDGKLDAVPVSALSWLGHGMQSINPIAINTYRWGAKEVDRGLTRNPLLGLLQVPDFIYVVNVVLSLLAVLFMFDAVCGEKEAGTLRLTLSNPVPRHLVLLGKWIGGYLVLMIPFLIATIGGLVYAWSQGVLAANSEQLTRIGLLLLTSCLYIAVFFNLSLFVSAATDRSATSLLVCLFLWVTFIIAVPNMAPVTAQILRETPSLHLIESNKEAVDREYQLKIDQLTQTTGELAYGKKIEQERERLEKERDARKRQWDRYFEDRKHDQFSLAKTLARTWPSGCWIFAAVALTDTGPAAHERLVAARNRLEQTYKEKCDKLEEHRRQNDWKFPEMTVEEFPALMVQNASAAQSLMDALNDMLILIILNVVCFMAAFMRFLRYDVR